MGRQAQLKLLIIDDNSALRQLIRGIVLPLACNICECADGADALSDYLAQKPDVVLMDIRMNHVDGIEATRRITAIDRNAKILIVTDYDDEELREASMLAGAWGYVLKDNLLELLPLLNAIGPSCPEP